jgi:anti-sigma B factor antagonist
MLKVHTRNLGNVAVVCLQGRIVNGETSSLREAVDAQLNGSAVVLDLARVSTIDASGLGLMLALRRQAEAKGVGLKLMNVSKFVKQVFEITRLDTVFEVIPRVEPLPARSQARQRRLNGRRALRRYPQITQITQIG